MADHTTPSETEKIESLIKRSIVCRLGISDGKVPYVIPLSFGYRDRTLYFHSGTKGKKLALLRANPQVGFEFDTVEAVMEAESPCSWDMRYESIVGTGRVEFIEDTEDRIKALQVIVSQYTDRPLGIPDARAKSTVVFKVVIDNMAYKRNSP